MGNLTTATVFVWTLNIIMFISQAAMINLGGSDSVVYYNCSGSILETYSDGQNCESIIVPNSKSISNDLPVSSKVVDSGSGIGFIDVINSVKTWIENKVNYIVAIVLAPYNLLSSIPGIPQVFVGAVSILWYGVSILLLVAFILGRDI